jgi:predicted nucleotidyltransferase
MDELPIVPTVPIALDAPAWHEVRRILQKQVPEWAVWAFGSRVMGNPKPYSDLDLVVMTDQPLSLVRMADLNEAFDESDLPFRVDIVDWAATSPSFREIILATRCLIKHASEY